MELRKLELPGSSLAVNRASSTGRDIRGLAAVFYDPRNPNTEYIMQRDMMGRPLLVERIKAGAFRDSLRSYPIVAVLWNHDPGIILGRTVANTLELQETALGLEYRFDAPQSPNGDNVLEAVRRRDATGASFGFRIEDERIYNEGSVTIRELRKVRLYEISITWSPAYRATSANLNNGTNGERTTKTRPLSIRRARLNLRARMYGLPRCDGMPCR